MAKIFISSLTCWWPLVSVMSLYCIVGCFFLLLIRSVQTRLSHYYETKLFIIICKFLHNNSVGETLSNINEPKLGEVKSISDHFHVKRCKCQRMYKYNVIRNMSKLYAKNSKDGIIWHLYISLLLHWRYSVLICSIWVEKLLSSLMVFFYAKFGMYAILCAKFIVCQFIFYIFIIVA